MLPTVIAIDDSMAIRRTLQLALVGVCTLETFATAQEGLQRIRQQPPALLLLDEVLPDGTGAGVCAELANNDATKLLRIVILSTQSEAIMLPVYSAFPAVVRCLAKPFSYEGIARLVKGLLSQWQGAENKETVAEELVLKARDILQSSLQQSWEQNQLTSLGSPSALTRLLTDDAIANILTGVRQMLGGEKAEDRPPVAVVGLWDADVTGVQQPLTSWLRRHCNVRVLDLTANTDYIGLLVRERPRLVLVNVESLPAGTLPEHLAYAIRGREELRGIKLMATCCVASLPNEERWRQAGFDEILTKPFGVRELVPWLDVSKEAST